MTDRIPISAIVNARREEGNLVHALASVTPWADEIFLADVEGDSLHAEIARSFDATFVAYDRIGALEDRGIALERCRNEWVFVLNADELAPEPLSRKLQELARGEADAYRLPRQNYIAGRAMSGAGWGPDQDRQLRFFRRGCAEVHPRFRRDFVPAREARVEEVAYRPGEAIVHFGFAGVGEFLERMNRYTDSDAAHRLQSRKPLARMRSLRKALRTFRDRYWRMGGRRDGWQGFYFSLLMAVYEVVIDAKAWEERVAGGPQSIRQGYQDVAKGLLESYEHDEVAV